MISIESDESDVEVIAEVEVKNSRCRKHFQFYSDIDLDDILDENQETSYEPVKREVKGRSSVKRKSLEKYEGTLKRRDKGPYDEPEESTSKRLVEELHNNGNCSDSTDIIESDHSDVESLPSIPSPSATPACSSTSGETAFRNSMEEITYDNNRVGWNKGHTQSSSDDDIEELPVGNCSKPSYSSTSSDIRNQRQFEDPVSDEIDDIFQSIEFSSLSDFLADQERKKAESLAKKVEVELSPDKEPKSYQVDLKKYRKAKGPSQEKPKKQTTKSVKKATTGSQSTERSSSQTSSSRSCGGNSQNPPSSMASSSSKDAGKQKTSSVMSVMMKIHEDFCTDQMAASFLEKELKFQLVDNPVIDGLILFERHMAYKAYDKQGLLSDQEHIEADENAMIIFPIEKHLELIQNELNVIDNDSKFSGDKDSQCLTEWIKDVRRRLPGKKITLLIEGHDAYVRKIQRSKQKEYRDRIAEQGDNGKGKKKRAGKSKLNIQLSKTEIQSAMIHMQLHTSINYRFYEKPAELADILFQYCKSIGEAPAKLAKINTPGFDWYAVADSVGGVPVDEDGKGMKGLWIQQLCQFPGVGQESAIAIARIHKNPKDLYKTYKKCRSVDEGKGLLTDIQVTLGVGPLKKTRRLGPEASKKIYRFFTSTDGDGEIQL